MDRGQGIGENLKLKTQNLKRFSPPCSLPPIPVIILIGLPGSGKSSFAHCLQARPGWRLISTDAIRSHLFGDEAIQGPWLKVWSEVGREFREAARSIQQGEARAAVYDATNVVRKSRREAIALARESGFTHLTGIWLNEPLEVCLQRNQQRDRQVPEAVIERMNRRLWGAPPSIQEGFDCLIEMRSGFRPVDREFGCPRTSPD